MMIGLIILCCMLTCVSVFELLQIKMLWNEMQNKRYDNKELSERIDIQASRLNSINDELREYTRVLTRLP